MIDRWGVCVEVLMTWGDVRAEQVTEDFAIIVRTCIFCLSFPSGNTAIICRRMLLHLFDSTL